MKLNSLKRIYEASPAFLKFAIGKIPPGIRYGKDYRSWYEYLSRSTEHDSLDKKLFDTLAFAYEIIPFYKKLYDSDGIHPLDIKSKSDFSKLPTIDKEQVVDNYRDFLNPRLQKKDFFYVTSGGTSGEQTKFLQSTNVWKKELAFFYRLFADHGCTPTTLRASFRGSEFGNRLWKMNPIHNEICISPFSISKKTIRLYVDLLNKYKPQFFHGYPSAITNFAQIMKDNNVRLSYNVQTVFFISEAFSKDEISLMKDVFGANVISFYGMSERVIFAPIDSNSYDGYIWDERYGFCEIVTDTGQFQGRVGVTGEIVGTGFDNFAMPLIRYKTGDYASNINIETNKISLLEGRWEKAYVIGSNQEKIFISALNIHSDTFDGIRQYQYCNIAPGKMVINVISDCTNKDELQQRIVKEFKRKVGTAMNITCQFVDEPILTPRGKFKKVVRTFE